MYATSCMEHHKHRCELTDLNILSVGSQLLPNTLNISNGIKSGKNAYWALGDSILLQHCKAHVWVILKVPAPTTVLTPKKAE